MLCIIHNSDEFLGFSGKGETSRVIEVLLEGLFDGQYSVGHFLWTGTFHGLSVVVARFHERMETNTEWMIYIYRIGMLI